MKAITVEKTIQEITGYEADDGTWFRTEAECKKYEESAHCAAKSAADKYITNRSILEAVIGDLCGCYEDDMEVYDIKDAHALQVVNTYFGSMNPSNRMIPPECIGHKVCIQHYYDDTYINIHGTRVDMELRFSKMLDDLFKDGESDA